MFKDRVELTPTEAYQELARGRRLIRSNPAEEYMWEAMRLDGGTFRITDMLTGHCWPANSLDVALNGWAKFDKDIFSSKNPEWVEASLVHLRAEVLGLKWCIEHLDGKQEGK